MSKQLSTFKTPFGYNEAKNQLTLLFFDCMQKYRHCMLVRKVLLKQSMVIFGLEYRLEKY